MRSDDCGVTFNDPVSCPASAPHGPVLLRDGTLLYLGKQAQLPGGGDGMGVAGIVAATSSTKGDSWEVIAHVPNDVDEANNEDYHEPHLVELRDGRLLGLIRTDSVFGMNQTVSDDGGRSCTGPPPCSDLLTCSQLRVRVRGQGASRCRWVSMALPHTYWRIHPAASSASTATAAARRRTPAPARPSARRSSPASASVR